MSNRFPAKPTTQPHQTYAISLPLQAALTSLNVSLEEELTRYRRHRQGYAPTLKSYALRPSTSGNQGKPLDLVSVPPERPQPTSPPATPAAPSPKSVDPELETALSTSFADQNLAEPDTGFEPDSPPDDYLESSEELLRSLAEEEEEEETPLTQPAFNPWLSPLGIGLTLLLILLCITFGVIFLNPSLIRHLLPNSPSQQPIPTPAEPSPTPGNPSEVSQSPHRPTSEFDRLTLERLSILEPKQPVQPSPMASPVVDRTPLPPTPAEEERPSGLNMRVLSLPVFSTQPQPSAPESAPVEEAAAPLPPPPTPKTVPTETVPLNPPELPQLQGAAPIVPPEAPSFSEPVPPQSYIQGFAGSIPIPVDMPPEQEWMPEPVATVPESGNPNSYYVVANYEDGQTMAKIQSLIPDAYLRNFEDGIYVQLAVFEYLGMAEALVEELKIEGISAKIYDYE
ncbi:hypothetical protein [Roseofilum capinflatum]|uniref:SPOR domain-containing protein n=1 Tax=Roseofilum capinflatum BLCC-M114 TaxID=3022440 RepID=A0ABT7B0L8_9CYAN|nr:hypothetical protein [Roseofilum capinflatum]MDJ1172676.1 hypothetical protein [Roseofilum capinflatum BLCC-M114]